MGMLGISAQETDSGPGQNTIEIRIHPNPVYVGVIDIESNLIGPKTIRIYDLFGKVVFEKRIDSDKLPLNTLVPGVYMVQLQQQGHLATKKLVIR